MIKKMNYGIPLIFDNGTGWSKVGYSGDNAPKFVFPTTYRHLNNNVKNYVGNEAESQCSMQYPMERGIITNWDYMENIWRYTFSHELKVDSEDHPILLPERPMNPIKNRDKTYEIMFEVFNTPAMFVANSAILSLFSSSKTSGTVVESGDAISHIVPIYEGYTIDNCIECFNFGGRDLDDYLKILLTERGYNLFHFDKDIARDIKEKFCYVSIDFDNDLKNNRHSNIKYSLPDGKDINISSERFKCTETLFQPNLLGMDTLGIHQSIYNSIQKCDNEEIRNHLYSSILLSGGSTMFNGLSERLKKEITLLAPDMSTTIISPPNRKYSTWIGGSILSSLSTFQNTWVSNFEYQEFGTSITHEKCL
ncbi:actin [Tieghemostelium lacteum]|uniref:Actin n=1 Tax=Tieghemostelium lacteum TaxID=361077 RepID=A0A151Z3G5_TIELA|nr:actin [Tieghemostelium lacteum]|eukprot:KYQ88489.1 actin [Tieghemostelium lacteum]